MDSTTFGEGIERIRLWAEKSMSELEMPGLQLALTDRERVIASLNLGYANLDAQRPVTDDTLFEFGSIGKSFTAICLLQLEAEGKVDLHAPFETQLPWWSVKSAFEPITVHHILSHSSGLISGTDGSPEQRSEVWAMRNTRTLTAPGAKFHYSNAAYKALGLLIEQVTGQRYGDVVQERIFGPLGMRNSLSSITNDGRRKLAIGYQDYFDDRPRVHGNGVVPAPWLESDSGDGSLCASASDLAIYLRMLLNRGAYTGGRILTDEQFTRMTTPRIGEEGSDNRGYGYGIAVPFDGSMGRFGHGGGMVGFISAMTADMETGFGAVVFTNSMNGVSKIADYALDVLRAVQAGDPLPDVPERLSADYSGYHGTFTGPTGSITITGADGSFMLERDGTTVPLSKTPYSDGDLVDTRPLHDLFPYAFVRNDDGAIVRVVHGGEEWTAEGQEPPGTPDPDLLRLTGHYRSYNPWQPNFRIVARGDGLYRLYPDGSGELLERDGDAWRADSDESGPELFWIDVMLEGTVAQLRDQLGSTWDRVFTP